MTSAQDRADRLAEQLQKLAEQAASSAAGDLSAAVEAAHPALLAAWVRAFGGVEALPTDPVRLAEYVAVVHAVLTAALNPAQVDLATVTAAWRVAYALGVEHAQLTAWWTPETRGRDRRPPAFPVDAALRDQLARALRGVDAQALGSRGFVAVQEAVVRARGAARRVDAATAYEVTAAATAAVRDVAREKAADVLWVAERDGCLHCLAYAGETTTGVFPSGLTFGDRPLQPYGPLLGPPLHPHCRCSLEIWHPTDVAVVESLRREAKRSVLRGESVDPLAPRLRAADRLLARGAGLPKTVEERAARAVRRGQFERRDQGNG